MGTNALIETPLTIQIYIFKIWLFWPSKPKLAMCTTQSIVKEQSLKFQSRYSMKRGVSNPVLPTWSTFFFRPCDIIGLDTMLLADGTGSNRSCYHILISYTAVERFNSVDSSFITERLSCLLIDEANLCRTKIYMHIYPACNTPCLRLEKSRAMSKSMVSAFPASSSISSRSVRPPSRIGPKSSLSSHAVAF